MNTCSGKSPIIKIQKISKTYYLGKETIKAVDRISLDIYPQEYLSILGSSGSGKSTLMYLIGLLETPSKGNIILNSLNTSKLTDKQTSSLRNQTIGFIFQSFNLINKFTILENILLPIAYAKKNLDFNPQTRAFELLKKFNIFDKRNFYPNKISGGQQQRVAIARALIMNPQIILADEPTGNLDSKTGPKILNLIENLRKEFGTTIIIVTHEKKIAQRADKSIYIKDGRIVNKYL